MHKVVISLSKERNPRVGPKHNSDAFINLADGGLAVAGLVPLHISLSCNTTCMRLQTVRKTRIKKPKRSCHGERMCVGPNRGISFYIQNLIFQLISPIRWAFKTVRPKKTHNNFGIKRILIKIILEWVTFWKVLLT